MELTTDPAFHRHAALEAGLKAGVAVPILVGSEVAGVLEFYTYYATGAESFPPGGYDADRYATGPGCGTRAGHSTAAAQQEALLQREKLAAMGSLLASVAGEPNNPLAIIVTQADNLREEYGNHPAVELLAEIVQAADRCKRLVQNFLTLARQHPPNARWWT